MTPERFRIVKHATAALFAVTVVGVLIAGIDGVIGAVQRLTRAFAATRAAQPAPAPVVEAPATPGVVPAFVVPPSGPAQAPAAPVAPAPPAQQERRDPPREPPT